MHIYQAKELLFKVGITLKKIEGNFIVNKVGGKETTAYYTDDLQDAFNTGMKMAASSIEDKVNLTDRLNTMIADAKTPSQVAKLEGFMTVLCNGFLNEKGVTFVELIVKSWEETN